ncbi:MAG: pyridoxal phosphate-dependent aminotransferase [Proteobacteria bacterium]|nr:pyridoxal phosphate-dependent aminotransferase [Pseudomonadota bacterium]
MKPAVPPLSRRILRVKSSPTVALNAKAKALAKEGVKVYNFAVGEPDFPTPKAVVDKAIAALQAGRTKYGPAGGGAEFLQAISSKLKRENGLDFPPSQIVAGIGAKEILFHIGLALINDGDEVIIPSPYWVSYPDQVVAAGGVPVFLPMPEDPAAKPLDVNALKRAATDKTVAIVLNSPSNPAGTMYDERLLHELGTFLLTTNWWIISDEIYEYMAFDHPHVSLLKLFPQLAERFILVNGLSKGAAMTGWRVGYCAGPTAVMKMVRDLQSHSSTCLPPFIEDAATYAISQGNTLLKDEVGIMKGRRDLALSLLKKIPGVKVAQPHGAFYIFIDVRPALQQAKTKIDTFALSEKLLLEQHIALVPGDAFGAPGYLRLSYACDEATITGGLQRLAAGLSAL